MQCNERLRHPKLRASMLVGAAKMVDLSTVNPSTWIAALSAVAAISSAIFAFRNSATARRALALSTATSQSANANFTLYLIDAFRYRPRETNSILYVFCVSIESKSTLQNSIVDAELRIPFVKEKLERTAIFRHNEKWAESTPLSLKNVLKLPTMLTARGGLIGNFCFDVPRGMLEGSEFGPFCLRVRYAEGAPSEVNRSIIMDVTDAENLEKKRKTGVPI
jgi:hypothetical protein